MTESLLTFFGDAAEPLALPVVSSIILFCALAAAAWVDLRESRLPDRITLPLLGVGLALAGFRTGAVPWEEITGAIVGYGLFWALGAAFWRLRQVDGLGLGDAKLMGAGGAWIGIALLPLVILLAAASALAFVLLSGRDKAAPLPFGPWLAMGIAVAWILRLSGG